MGTWEKPTLNPLREARDADNSAGVGADGPGFDFGSP